MLRPVYAGDFCRAIRCYFRRAEVASSFEHVRNLMQLRRDENCIELRDKNRLCKRAFKKRNAFIFTFLIKGRFGKPRLTDTPFLFGQRSHAQKNTPTCDHVFLFLATLATTFPN